MKSKLLPLMGLTIPMLMTSYVTAQQKSAEQGTNAIPNPKKEWKGVQGKTLADSKPDFIGQPQAPKGAPNVLIIMLDDAGYSNAFF